MTGDCSDQPCQRSLYYSRQVRLAMGKDAQRVKRVLLQERPHVFDARFLAAHPDLLVAVGPDLIRQIRSAVAGMAPLERPIYVVDPLLNLMMRFPADLDPHLTIKDLKKLLKVSQVG